MKTKSISISRGYKRYVSLIVVFIFSALFGFLLQAATARVGDYRSFSNTNWNNAASWEVCTEAGTPGTWTAATYYPGETTTPTQVTFGTVTILTGHTITIPQTGLQTSQPMDSVIINGQLYLQGSNSDGTFGLNTSVLNVYGSIYFYRKCILNLQNNAVVMFFDAVSLIGDCSHNQEIQVGGIKIAACHGAPGIIYTFAELMDAGGTLDAYIYVPTDGSSSCLDDPINLQGHFNGDYGTTTSGGSTRGVNYYWTVDDETTPISSGILTSPDALSPVVPLSTLSSGTHTITFTCTTYIGTLIYRNYQTFTVYVKNPSTAPTSITGTTIICSGSTTTLTVMGGILGDNATYQWGTGSTVGSNIISGATSVSYTTDALTAETTFWVRRVDPAPCNTVTDGVTTTVTVIPASTPPTSITGIQRICSGSTTTLTAAGGVLRTGGSYQWGTGSEVGSNIIIGATDESYTTDALTAETTFWVRRIDPAPCNTITGGVTATVLISNADALVWNGSVDNDWHTAPNWTPNYIPVSCDNLNIPSGLTNYPTISSAATCNNITIESGATMLGNQFLTIVGTATVKQNLDVARRSWYMTSPIKGPVIPTPAPTAIQWYDETKGDPAGWTVVTSIGMNCGCGYMLNPDLTSCSKLTFNGELNDDEIIMSLPRTTGKTKEGFNLIGNPYVSYLNLFKIFDTDSDNDIDPVDTDQNILPTYWIRSKYSGLWGWDTFNLAANIGTANSGLQITNKIPPLQAFWFRTTTNAGASLILNNGLREHKDKPNNKFRAPKAPTAENKILRLQVSGGTTTDEAVVYFNANAADGYDEYDSPKMMNGSSSSVPDIYTTIGDEILAINGMNTIPYDTEIMLYFVPNTSVGPTYNLIANEILNFEAGTQVWIKNNLSGVTQLVSDGTPYNFEIAQTGANPKFSIIIKAPGTTTQLDNANRNNVFVSVTENQQIIVSSGDVPSSDASVSVYNSLGQRIVYKAITGDVTRIDNAFVSGVYLVTVINAGNKTTEKIIIR